MALCSRSRLRRSDVKYGVYPHATWKTTDPRTGDGHAVPTGQGFVDREITGAVPYGRMQPIREFARRADADKLASRLTFDLGLTGREDRGAVLEALRRKPAKGKTDRDPRLKKRSSVTPRCTRGLEVQTLIFPKSQFTEARARAWMKSQGMRITKIDETGTSYRFRQRAPTDFVRGTFRTIAVGTRGAKAVVGCPRPGRESDKARQRDPLKPVPMSVLYKAVGEGYDAISPEMKLKYGPAATLDYIIYGSRFPDELRRNILAANRLKRASLEAMIEKRQAERHAWLLGAGRRKRRR